jgi:hypothetical protein
MMLTVLTCALAWHLVAGPAGGQVDPEELRDAKALVFDREYERARTALGSILQKGAGDEADMAAFWIARCSEKLGDDQRALREYTEFLARRPADATLVEEARMSRIGLAARLHRRGQTQHLPVLRQGLADPDESIRYYSAFQVCELEAKVARSAVPVLEEILEKETDPDLLNRARLALLRLNPESLRGAEASPPERSRPVSWIKLRIYEAGASKADVSVNLPIGLAELVFKSLPDDARRELRDEGYDVDNFWQRLKALGPTEILKIESGDGGRVEIWLE